MTWFHLVFLSLAVDVVRLGVAAVGFADVHLRCHFLVAEMELVVVVEDDQSQLAAVTMMAH